MKDPNNKFMEQNLPMVTDRTSPTGVGVSDDIKVIYQFHTIFIQTHQEILYTFKEMFQNVHSRFVNALDYV